MHSPKLLILDEPTSGLDPIMQQVFFELLEEEKKKGTTILYSTHILSEISKICDRVGIIRDGKLLKIDKIEDLYIDDLNIISVCSNDVDLIISDLGLTEYDKNDKLIKFKYTDDINKLIKKLSMYNIDKLLIEEATLEEILLHYYK